MKKIFTLMALACMAFTAQAQGKFALEAGTGDFAAGTQITSVPNITLTFGFAGEADYKDPAADASVEGYTAYTAGNGVNGKADGGSGTTYILEPAKNGEITVAVVVNANKAFYVLENGTALSAYNGITVAEKTYTTYKFDVSGGKTYKVFCTGSKLGFYGFEYTVSESQGGSGDTPVVESGKKLVEMMGYSLYRNDYVQKEDGTWGYETVKLDEPILYDYNRYFYNAANQNSVETTSSAHYRYNYNADGTVASRESWTSAGGSFHKSLVNEYEYDAAKNCIKMTSTSYDNQGAATPTGGSLYEDYENGYYKVMKNFSADGTITYEVHYVLTFNEANQIVSSIQMTGAEFDQPGQGTFYTYENGVLVKQVTAYYTPGAAESE